MLVERLAPAGSALWLHGQDITSVTDFWSQLGMRLGVASSWTKGAEQETALDTRFGAAVHIGPVADGSWERTDGERDRRSESATVPQHTADAVECQQHGLHRARFLNPFGLPKP